LKSLKSFTNAQDVAATTVASLNFAVIVDLRLLSQFGANLPIQIRVMLTTIPLVRS
jgi:hypothetical protein